MLTTISITSMNQGKIAPRYDVEPRSEEAARRMEITPWLVSPSPLFVWPRLSAWFGRRNFGHQSPTRNVASARR